MHVLFVTENRFDRHTCGDGSTRYRCFNVAEALIACGHRATVASLPEVAAKHLARYQVISILRPRASGRLKHLIDTARANGTHLVADFDDLIFDIEAAPESPLVLNRFADEQTVARGFQRFADAGQWVDEITVSTKPLAVAAEKCFRHAKVHVLPNGLSPLWLQYADIQYGCDPNPEYTHSTISYLPGTRSHDADFRVIQPAVSKWLGANENRTLRIVGDLTMESDVGEAHQIIKQPLVPFFQLPEKIRGASVTLAPLVENRFNQAKSHIKFLESAAFGIPVVATANADLDQHRNAGGLFCPESVGEWVDAIDNAARVRGQSNITTELQNYVRNQWSSTETSQDTIERWKRHSTSHKLSLPRPATAADPDAFYLGLRPIPRAYTRQGWQPDKTTHAIIFETTTGPEALDLHSVEQQVKACGKPADQWLVLVHTDSSAVIRKTWKSTVGHWKPSADHIEVFPARSLADRYSLFYQCEQIIFLTPASATPQSLPFNRTSTAVEQYRITVDRWKRKARKFRESPRRFFADTDIGKRGGL